MDTENGRKQRRRYSAVLPNDCELVLRPDTGNYTCTQVVCTVHAGKSDATRTLVTKTDSPGFYCRSALQRAVRGPVGVQNGRGSFESTASG